MTAEQTLASTPRTGAKSWLLNPYLLILLSALLDTAGEVLLSKGAKIVAGGTLTHGALGWMAPLASAWTWIGIVSYITSLVAWLAVLRSVPLSIAFPLISVVHVMVPAASHFFLHEVIPLHLWIGVGMIFLGILVIARPLMHAEEKL
ncbi:MAG TPA: EamA family transporter [Tepidisphaeraceae bacterium]|jgi:drug/metabolite transporter (DMT)-like permease|nr:EamA family transporter [Tepidisphaeraceae bacterium]